MANQKGQVTTITARATRPNLGVERAYYAKLRKLLNSMHGEVTRELKKIYREWEPVILELPEDDPYLERIMDAKKPKAGRRMPKELREELEALFEELGEKWIKRYDLMSNAIATKFIETGSKTNFAQLMAALREVGFTTKISTTAMTKEILRRAIWENVNLIKTIPSEYFRQIEKAVTESVYVGRDLAGLEKNLLERYAITDKRARLIAKDQNNKASQALSRANAEEAGITRGIWQHMRASKVPRPSHELMDGTEFDLREGCYDPDEGRNVMPGELIMCNCGCRWVIPGVESGFAHQNRLSEAAIERQKTWPN
jgi:uncharacterized protein with gpF-like domain